MDISRSSLYPQRRLHIGRSRLLQLIDDLQSSDLCRDTVYISPKYSGETEGSDSMSDVDIVVRHTGSLDTGLVVFLCGDLVVSISPPFPILKEAFFEGANTIQLVELLHENLVVGIVLLRLGYYAVGVVRGDNLVSFKHGTRYVKRSHRAGGSSQRRFERSRQRLIRELYDKTCLIAKTVLVPFSGELDYLFMGGEKHTLYGLVSRCTFLERLAPITLERRLDVERPGREALERIPYEIRRSRVTIFTRHGAEYGFLTSE